MKNYLTAFLFCALIGVGFQNSSSAAPKSDTPTEPSAQCQDLEKQMEAAETAADQVCATNESSAECQAADAKVDDLYKQAEAAKCLEDGGDGGDGGDGNGNGNGNGNG